MAVISFASSKGGAGKTTSAIILGTELVEGASVIMIDADPAKRLSRWASLSPLPDNLHVLESGGERSILTEIDESQRKAAFVIIDLEGSASRLTSFAISESDLVLVPSGEEQQDADAAIDTLAEIAMESRARRRNIAAAIVLTRTSAAVKSRLERHIHHELEKSGTLLTTELHRRTAFSSLHNAGGGLRQLNSEEVNGISKAIQNAQSFASEVVDLLEMTKDA